MKSETPLETAERIAAPTIGKVKPAVYHEIVNDIEAALNARDERAAKIADKHVSDIEQLEGHDYSYASGFNQCAKSIAAALRGKD